MPFARPGRDAELRDSPTSVVAVSVRTGFVSRPTISACRSGVAHAIPPLPMGISEDSTKAQKN
jgi:hypothetical protein